MKKLNSLTAFGFLMAFFVLLPSLGLEARVLSTDPTVSLPSESSEVPEKNNETANTATLVDLSGNVKILKKGSENWTAAQKKQTLEAGDQLLTGKDSFADIAYDSYLLNITHLKENTKAEIQSINPTVIYLHDGSIFSAFDGLGEKSKYEVSTPTAVAAVRGTHFDVAYDQATQKFTAAALPTGAEDHVSKIFISNAGDKSGAGVELVENKQLDLKFGQPLKPALIKPADPVRLQAGKAVFSQMGNRMEKFQELRRQGQAHIQEMKQRGSKENPEKDPRQMKPEKEKIKKEDLNPQNDSGRNASNSEEALSETEQAQRDLNKLIEENEPQHAKPFGSYKPVIKDTAANRSQNYGNGEDRPSQESNSGPEKPRAFGELKPQINPSPSKGEPGQRNQPQQGPPKGPPPAGPKKK